MLAAVTRNYNILLLCFKLIELDRKRDRKLCCNNWQARH